jgi:phage tail sheath protein FI
VVPPAGGVVPPAGVRPAAGNWISATGGASGVDLTVADYLGGNTGVADKRGIYALLKTDIFNILCIPPIVKQDGSVGDIDPAVLADALQLCVDRRAMLIVDSPQGWTSVSQAAGGIDSLSLSGSNATNAALYFPWIRIIDPDTTQGGQMRDFPPSGAIAGIYARTDASRGVWKAPAGIDASLNGARGLTVSMTDLENGQLNPIGVNCLRTFPIIGNIVWGSRTGRGADVLADQWKYVPVRRVALYIEESLYRGTKWVVFEPNDEPLWASIRLNVGAFMHNLFRQGAFQGKTPREAYLVKCDKDTTTQNDIDRGIVNILVGFAPLKPAEFVIIQIQQLAGQVEV